MDENDFNREEASSGSNCDSFPTQLNSDRDQFSPASDSKLVSDSDKSNIVSNMENDSDNLNRSHECEFSGPVDYGDSSGNTIGVGTFDSEKMDNSTSSKKCAKNKGGSRCKKSHKSGQIVVKNRITVVKATRSSEDQTIFDEFGEERRKRRKSRIQSETPCPVCNLTLRGAEVDDHLRQEVEKLNLLSSKRISRSLIADGATPSRGNCSYLNSSNSSASSSRSSNWQDYRKVRINRCMRQQGKRWSHSEEVICPVCQNPTDAASALQLEEHIERCLKKAEGDSSSEEENVEVVDGDEYEWCGMRRVRVTSLLRSQGRLEDLGTMLQQGDEEENVEVCLLQEGEDVYGSSQYNEEDLRQINRSPIEELDVEEDDDEDTLEDVPQIDLSLPGSSRGICENVSSRKNDLTVKALRSKMRDMERNKNVICLICHGPYESPLVSTICWHVHCKNCWLKALASQKLCAQCKVIVSPSDLRRIFI